MVISNIAILTIRMGPCALDTLRSYVQQELRSIARTVKVLIRVC